MQFFVDFRYRRAAFRGAGSEPRSHLSRCSRRSHRLSGSIFILVKIKNKIYVDEIQKQVDEDIASIKNGNYISKIDRYLNSFYEKQETILDYLSENFIIALDEINKINQRLENVNLDSQNVIKLLIEQIVST